MKNNVSVFLTLVLGVGAVCAAMGFIAYLMITSLEVQGLRSLILLVIFLIVLYRTRKADSTSFTIILFFLTFIGMFMDAWGNFIYNKPLELLFSPFGTLHIVNDTLNYAPGKFATNYGLFLEQNNGEMKSISVIVLYIYRFIQYLVLYGIIGYLIRRLTKQNIEILPKQDLQSEVLNADMKTEVIQLLRNQKKVVAIKIIKDNTSLSLAEAKRYADFLENEYVK